MGEGGGYNKYRHMNNKQLFFIGLGKMGQNMTLRLKEKGWEVFAYDKSEASCREAKKQGISVVSSFQEGISSLKDERKIVWLMIPHQGVRSVLENILPLLEKDDVIIDGGNSFFETSIEHYALCLKQGITFIDAGVSGGPKGARDGACVMIGGEKGVARKYEQVFCDISAPKAYAFFDAPGAGHFVKMVHNGIEYGMMQAIAEGFSFLKQSKFDLDLQDVAKIYNKRSVVESRLVGWLEEGLERYGEDLEEVSGSVAHSGEGQWTVETAKALNIRVENIEQALEFRKSSQENPSYTGKLLSAMRNAFGGHEIKNR